jgi:hypothetical protein
MAPRSRAYDSDLPIDIAEPLSILPGDVHTYHLPLPDGFVLDIELDADGPLAVRLLDSTTWELATTIEARWAAAAHHAVDATINSRIQFIPPTSTPAFSSSRRCQATTCFSSGTLATSLPTPL